MPLIIIPARYQSSRYPGKPLAPLVGAGGRARSLIERSWRAARAVPGDHRVVIATDDERIAAAARGFGAEVAMTPSSCANGTERCAAVLDTLDDVPEIIVNFQGDALLTPPWFVTALIEAMAGGDVRVATPVLRCDGGALAALRDDRAAGRVGGTTAVFGAGGDALYFSKEVIPYAAGAFEGSAPTPVFHHVGLYAYTPEALDAYRGWPAGRLETLEGLEQLRFLENGVPVRCVEVTAPGRVFWELNNPSDVARIEAALRALGED